jgi:hypothetical protein
MTGFTPNEYARLASQPIEVIADPRADFELAAASPPPYLR